MKAQNLVSALVTTVLLTSGSVFAVNSASPTSVVARGNATTDVLKIDKHPVALKRVLPVYPRALREDGIQGVATVDMLIDSTGKVIAAELVSSTVPEFGPLAIEAAKKWTFAPALAQGKPVATRVRVPFEFVMPQLDAI